MERATAVRQIASPTAWRRLIRSAFGVLGTVRCMGFSELFARAAGRHGVVWTGDCEAAGVAPRTLRARAARESWPHPYPNTWLAPGMPISARATLAAAVLAADGHASRWSALWLHGMDVALRPRPQVVVPYGRRGRVLGDIEVLRSRTLSPSHLTVVDGVPTVVLARAFADLAPQVLPGALRHLVIDAEHAGRLLRSDLVAISEELPRGVPGLGRLRRVVADLAGTRSDSGFEHEVREGLAATGFPVHREPFPYRCEDGVMVHLDIALPQHWVVVECDGRSSHIGRAAFSTDRIRWTQIVRQWTPVWVSWDRWRQDRHGVFADVRRAIELADPRRVPARPAHG